MFQRLKSLYKTAKARGLKNSARVGLKFLFQHGPKALVKKIINTATSHPLPPPQREYKRSNTLELNAEQKEWLANISNSAISLPQEPVSLEILHKKKIAVHIHAFYPTIVGDFLSAFRTQETAKLDLFITTKNALDAMIVSSIANSMGVRIHTLEVVPNIGRDLGPLFTKLRHLFHDYDFLCHLHTKRSLHTHFGDEWRRYLAKNLIATPQIMAAQLNHLNDNPDCAVIYPLNFNAVRPFTSIEDNNDQIKAVLNSLGLDSKNSEALSCDFPAGSMCWMRCESYRSFVDKLPSIEEYDDERGQIDKTTAHALERLLVLIPIKAGYKAACFKPFEEAKGTIIEQSTQMHVTEPWQRLNPAIAARPRQRLKPPFSRKYNQKSLNIHWIIPDFIKGAGGHTTIFRFVKFLDDQGHRQTVWVQSNALHFNSALRLSDLRDWYQPVKNVQLCQLPTDVKGIAGDIVIATDCWTTFAAAGMRDFKDRYYFLQDNEAQFFAMGENYLTAMETFSMDFKALCAGEWLKSLAQKHGMEATAWHLAVDHSTYFPPKMPRGSDPYSPVRIAFYSRQNTPRRAVGMGIAALNALTLQGYSFEVILYGEPTLDTTGFKFQFIDQGVVDETKLNQIYGDCDIGIVFSTTNYSLAPLEMMATGLPVVDLNVPSINAVFPNHIMAKAEPTVTGIMSTIAALINSESERERLSQAGVEYAANFSWEKSFDIVNDTIIENLQKQKFEPLKWQAAAPEIKTKYKATVAIPTFNAGPAFETVLQAITAQTTTEPYDILIVDSGSSDDTVDLVKRYPKARLHQIENKDFQHGRTRNLCVELSESEITAFLTQDALPANKKWLEALTAPFEQDPEVVGVFGRHKAYDHHDAYVKTDLENHFNNFKHLASVYHWGMSLPDSIIHGTMQWRLTTAFYSDNNSAMRKAFWHDVPYPEVNWGEDYIWADEVIRLGLKKAYANQAIVYHSHSYEKNGAGKVGQHEHDLFWDTFQHRFASDAIDVAAQIEQAVEQAKAFGQRKGLSKTEIEARVEAIIAEHIGRNYSLI